MSVAALASGEDERVPEPFASRLIDGESPVRVYRDLRGMTQSELAARAGLNRIQVSDIERGESTGSVKTLSKIADALGVLVDDLV